MNHMTNWYNVGKLVNTHGIRGEVRVVSRTDFPEERYQVGNKLYLFMDKQTTPIELIVKSHRQHKSFDLLTFEGYDNMNQVEPFKGGILKITEEQLTPLDEGEYYYHEIIGCDVYSMDDVKLGTIKEVLSPGANDVWVMKDEKGKEVLIPYIEPVVKKIDVTQKKVWIELLEGLL